MEFEGEVGGEGMAAMLSSAEAGGALDAALGTALGVASGASPDMFIGNDIFGDVDGIGSEIKNLIAFNALGIA